MTDALMTTLKTLKLFGMAESVASLAEQASPVYQQAVPILETLLKAEVAERDVRSINYQTKAARFPAYRDLAGFEFTESQVDEVLVRALHRPHADPQRRRRGADLLRRPAARLLFQGPYQPGPSRATTPQLERCQRPFRERRPRGVGGRRRPGLPG